MSEHIIHQIGFRIMRHSQVFISSGENNSRANGTKTTATLDSSRGGGGATGQYVFLVKLLGTNCDKSCILSFLNEHGVANVKPI